MAFRTLVLSAFLLFTMPLALAAEAPAGGAAATKAVAVADTPINVNTADVMALTSLKGIGEKKALAIIAYRKAHGPFSSAEQFEAVPGVGPATVAKNKGRIVFR